MHKRKFIIFISLILILVLTAVTLPAYPGLAQEGNDGNGQVTPGDQEAAAALFQEQFQAALADGTVTLAAAPDPGGTPHYFGPYPNWANSPLPRGVIASIDVTNGGSGYTAPTVEIADLYYDAVADPATAMATVTGGVITDITLTYAGSGYSAPVIIITDTSGTGANASATISPPFTGGIRKFVDALPGLGATEANNLGQYIPQAVPDTVTYPDSDYYEVALVEYNEQMHSDLPPTRHRGYVQLETAFVSGAHVALTNPADGSPILLPDGSQAYGVDDPHFMGPAIVSQRDVPVRIKFYNLLPTGSGGDLFIPVDTTVMGAGMAPNGEMYTENRATVHLHGNNSAWISDGTPHQWITPAGESTSYPKGVSVRDVPDMPPAGDGAMTLFYTNAQSARLMFYHDHAYGITRLNVYGGEAAAYLITDQVEQDLINGTNNSGVNPDLLQVLPDIGIPLVIQDRTFVDADAIAWQDPTWNWGTGARDPVTGQITEYVTGDLWYPHVYMPAQNPYNADGANPFGRWHYAAWFWPPATNLQYPPVPNPYYDPVNAPWEPPEIPGTPDNSSPGEAFMDTPIVNGTAYPYLEVEPTAYRFRILNAADDRFFNLQWYVADPEGYAIDAAGNTVLPGTGFGTEVRMVPAAPTPGWPETWPTDGREGGTPDPATTGPDWIQIGTEGGFLPKPVVVPNQPVTCNMDPTTFNAGNVQDHSLLLGTAERADVIVDFSQFAGKTLILYNDAPAAFPALDPHYDYYTNCPDRTDIGGAPTTQPGYGSNIRTIMQVRVGGTAAGLEVSSVNLIAGGSGYTTPSVNFVGGAGTGATATIAGAVDRISLNSLGSGYTAPVVTIDPPTAGIQATATATVTDGFITGITLTNGGSGYTVAPNVTITDAAGTGATAKATLTITGITVTAAGTGYTSTPVVVISDATGTGAGASAAASLVSTVPVPAYDLAALESVFAKTATKPGVFELSQDSIIVPSSEYDSAYNQAFPADTFVRQDQNSHTFQSIAGSTYTLPLEPKALQDEMGEVFDEYGRMNVMLGLELPFTAAGNQNFAMYGYASPPVEIIKGVYASQIGVTEDGTQIWKITHNGVDSHTIHTHLFNAQLINRVAWDGAIMPPSPNELGWKETFMVNPLEHTIIALRAVVPVDLPFEVPNSVRLIDPTLPEGEILMGGPGGFFDPNGNPVEITNHMVNFGWEYVYHCHILAHEEMDMMHAVVVAVPPAGAPSNLVVMHQGNMAVLTWTDNSPNETGFIIERAVDAGFTTGLTTFTVGPNVMTYSDRVGNLAFYYRVAATNTVGDTMTPGFPTMTVKSGFSNSVMVGTAAATVPADPTNLTASVQAGPQVMLAWTDNANNETSFVVERSDNGGAFSALVTVGPRAGTGSVNYTDTTVAAGNSYTYRVSAVNAAGSSNYSNTATVNLPAPPAAPTNVIATAARVGGSPSDRITLTWADAVNETGYTIQMATNSTFTANLVTITVGANTTTFTSDNVPRNTQFYLRIQAFNGAGQSVWVNATPFPIITP